MSQPPLDVPGLLRRYGLRPDKRLGQNFLVDPVALERVVSAAGVEPDDWVLEIGPGLGGLTRLLAGSAQYVVAVELDERLLPPLREVLSGFSNVRIVTGDILALDLASLLEPDYVVVANIPYYITSAVIRHLLEAGRQPQRITLTMQREVAERIVAEPGDLSLLALGVQVYGHPQIAARIPAGAFYPAPQVDSAVVRIDLYPEPAIPPHQLDDFFQVAKAGFSQKRKNLRNALAGGLRLEKDQSVRMLEAAGIDPTRRAETLSLEEWARLTDAYRS